MDVEPFSVELADPLGTARGTIQQRNGFLVTVGYNGRHGVGEATPLPGWTESYEECREALNRGANIATELDWGVALAKLDTPAARHGLSLAFAEARARASDEPLYRSLGRDDLVESVPVNATLSGDGTPSAVAHRAREAVKTGFQTLKLKVGTNGIEEDIERVRAIRDAVGDEIAIRVDANGAWTPVEARQAIDSLAVLDVEYVEQPLSTADLSAHAELRGSVDIALDESLVSHDIEDVIESDAADVVIIKPMVLGGPDRAVAAALRAQEAGIDPVISNTIDAVVARTGAVHVAARIPDVRPCGLATGALLETDLASDPAPIIDGEISVPQDAGIGLPERL
ncbi:o-succinylbenzoate synthase [Halovenus rubra]|uniref:O-succinylbenzoate synthase n=2 Tax=Halovenus rubra TaxID=869890 RepID=A0ACC7E467_9EURY|nr:o-succinylbenzoate synthase [Halovenus rubra]